MGWIRMDDEYAQHPKLSQVEGGMQTIAGWLNTAALCYCGSQLTDGFVPRGQVRKLIDVQGLALDGESVDPMQAAEALVKVGLWERRPNGYQIHDYLDYNPSKAKVEADRAAARDRMQRIRGSGREATLALLDQPDALDAYHRITGRRPTQAARGWVNRLAKDHGEQAVEAALAKQHQQSPDIRTLLSRTQDALRAVALDRTRREDAAREKAEREADAAARRQVEEASPEQREEAELKRQAIRIAMATGRALPASLNELRAFVAEHRPAPEGARSARPTPLGKVLEGVA